MDQKSVKFEFDSSRIKAIRSRERVSLLSYYWASHISEEEAASMLREGECFLLDAEPKMRVNGAEALRYVLIWKKEMVYKDIVKFAANSFVLASSQVKLDSFIIKNKLNPLAFEKKWNFPEGLPPDTVIKMNFDEIFEMGAVTRRKVMIRDGREVCVLFISAIDLTEEERQIILEDLEVMRNISHRNILNIWGCHTSAAHFSLLVDNTAVESLQYHLMINERSWSRLVSFSRQLCSALVYLEEMNIVHKKLSLNTCLVSNNTVLKLALFGLSTGLYPKRVYVNEVERCRWIPPECLGVDGVEYDHKSVVWTLGTIIWSIYHAGVTPFECESAKNIVDREYRKEVQLPTYEPFWPEPIAKVCDICWLNMENRPALTIIQTLFK